MGMTSDHQRFETLVGALLPQLYRYAYWLSRNRSLAEDVVQEALIRAWKSLDSLRDDSKAKSWLFTIIRREHARHYEKRRLECVDIDTVEVAETEHSPVEADAELDDLRRMVSRLDVAYREPLVLQVVVGCSCDEIAELMDLTRAAVLTRLFRARQQLMKMADAPAEAKRSQNGMP
ncbi:MAG: sigma-70 family RNA polymerase sigma factor [Xanthomonadaceae bacterium]|nr:sigma-70 family RNA polymerase sigma factor [Xanthomonadaceae bacterium]